MKLSWAIEVHLHVFYHKLTIIVLNKETGRESTKTEVSLNMTLVKKKGKQVGEEVPRGSISLCLHGEGCTLKKNWSPRVLGWQEILWNKRCFLWSLGREGSKQRVLWLTSLALTLQRRRNIWHICLGYSNCTASWKWELQDCQRGFKLLSLHKVLMLENAGRDGNEQMGTIQCPRPLILVLTKLV